MHVPTHPLIGALAAGLMTSAGASPVTPELSSWPAWMAGSWCASSGAEHTVEVWLAPAGGLMLGMSRTVVSPQNARKGPQFEFLRIELRDGITTYLAQPQGRPAVEFKLVQAGASSVRFENLAHDFPKRIEYRRDGNALRAEIAGPGKDGKQIVIGVDHELCPH